MRRLLPFVILALAFGVRAHDLSGQALRGDEAYTADAFRQPWGEAWGLMLHSDPNPPVYFLLMRSWMRLAGTSEFALRWASVLPGVAAAALAWRLGVRLAGRPAGAVGALWLALNPFLVWYSRDARGYALLVALTLAAAWQGELALRRGGVQRWLACGVLWWLALHTHYFAALPLALSLLVMFFTGRRARQTMALAAGIGLASLPWALQVAPFLAGHTKAWIAPASLSQAVWRTLAVFAGGAVVTPATTGLHALGAWLLGLLALAGAVTLALRRRLARLAKLLAIGPGVPAVLWLLSLWRPVFIEQYALTGLPGTVLLAAAGAGALGRRRPWALGLATAALTVASTLNLVHYAYDPAFAKSADWRGLARYLSATARPDEVVALNLPDPAFYHYFDGPQAKAAIPAASLVEEQNLPLSEADLTGLVNRYAHIRFLPSPNPAYDPHGWAGEWLKKCCEQIDDQMWAGFRIQTFDTPAGSLAARQPLTIDFAGGITLSGYRLIPAPAGGKAHLTLYWRASAPLTESYTVFVHLLAADGFGLGGADGLPRNGAQPTNTWVPGQDVIDPHSIELPADLPAGKYGLEIGLYILETGRRLPTLAGPDQVRLPADLEVPAP